MVVVKIVLLFLSILYLLLLYVFVLFHTIFTSCFIFLYFVLHFYIHSLFSFFVSSCFSNHSFSALSHTSLRFIFLIYTCFFHSLPLFLLHRWITHLLVSPIPYRFLLLFLFLTPQSSPVCLFLSCFSFLLPSYTDSSRFNVLLISIYFLPVPFLHNVYLRFGSSLLDNG